jgi:hypothetical protein
VQRPVFDWLGSLQANAQGTAESHVAAAKAIADSVPKNAKNELDYSYILAANLIHS